MCVVRPRSPHAAQLPTLRLRSGCGELAVPRQGNGLDAGVGAQRSEQVADVVSNRLDAQMELAGDLVGRMAPLEQA
jgi:hypothetical protein